MAERQDTAAVCGRAFGESHDRSVGVFLQKCRDIDHPCPRGGTDARLCERAQNRLEEGDVLNLAGVGV